MANLTQHIKDGFDNRYTKSETDAKIVELSPPTKLSIAKSAMLSGTASVTNTTLMAGMATKLYTGNGSTQSIDAGVDLATQWGDTANETYGGLVWIKNRDSAESNILHDTVRGVNKQIWTNLTNAETSLTDRLTSFNSNGFTLSSNASVNGSATYASWIFQTTHRITGTTNHGKAYTCHYNPISGFTIVKYEGSGITGHEIPHHLGRELGFVTLKSLTQSLTNWDTTYKPRVLLYNNLTDAEILDNRFDSITEENISIDDSGALNVSGNSYILYGWANSYYDDAGELNGNYYTYVDNDASDNQILHLTVHTDQRENVVWEINKTLNITGDWNIIDYERGITAELNANLSDAESTITANEVVNTASPAQYSMASETSNIQLNNLVVSFTNGVDANGVVSAISNLGSLTFSPTGGWDI